MKVATFMFELAKLVALLQSHVRLYVEMCVHFFVAIGKTELNMRFSVRVAVHSATRTLPAN